MVDVTAYLQSKNLGNLKTAGPDEVHLACPFCQEDPGKRGRLYVNVGGDELLAGLYFCHRCGTKGNLRTLRQHFGDSVSDEADDGSYLRLQIIETATAYYEEHLDLETFKWLKKSRGLTAATISERRIGWAPGRTLLFGHLRDHGFRSKDILATGLVVERQSGVLDFFQEQVTLPYLVNGQPVMIRGKEIGGKYLTPPGAKTRLFNTDTVWTAEELIVCEGEFDAMILEQLGYRAIGCPGASLWQEHWSPYLDAPRRVFCMFDPDNAGQNGALRLKDMVGHKVRIVELPVEQHQDPGDVDPSFLVVERGWTSEQFGAAMASAQRRSTLLATPREAVEEWLGLQQIGGLQLGFEKLDLLLAPGLLPGQVMVILAKTNSGKTILMLNLFQRMCNAQPDAKVLFISLEQTKGDWVERAARIWNFYNLDCPEQDVIGEAANYWQDRIRIVDKNRLTEAELHAIIDDFELEFGQPPTCVGLDYLGYYAHGFRGKDRYERVTEAIMGVKAISKERRTPVITPHQVSRSADFGSEPDLDNARDSGAVEETADFGLTLWNPDTMKAKEQVDHAGVLNMRIGKSRHGGKGASVRLQFGYLTLAIVPELTAEAKSLQRELGWRQDDTVSWRDAIARHRTGRPSQRSELGSN